MFLRADQIARPPDWPLSALRPCHHTGRAEIVGEMRGENLNGDDAIEKRVVGAIRLSHPARGGPGGDLVRT